MSQILTLFGGNRSIAPLNSLFPSSSVFDLDATIAASYSGGQLWKNIIANPADGVAQSAYDFNSGANNTPTTDDPTFTGAIGSANAYFSFDGGDYFTLSGTITSFLNSLHKGTSHTLIMCINSLFSTSGDMGLFATTDTYNSSNVGLSYRHGFSFLFYKQSVTTSSATASRGSISPVDARDRIIVLSYNSSANTVTSWVNSSTGTSTAMTFIATALDVVGVKPSIGAVGAASKLPSGSKIYSCAMLNSVVTDSDVVKIIKFYNARHKRMYA